MIAFLALGSLLMPPSFADDPPAAELVARDGGWVVEAQRSLGGVTAVGRAALHEADPDAGDPPHQHAAGARAWLSVGRKLMDGGEAAQALEAADAGLEELGDEYAPPATADSTTLKIYAAKDMARSGRIEDAAATTLGMLEERLNLYQQRYAIALSSGD